MYRIFISHSWNYANQYNKILDFLDNGGVKYYNHSVPKDDPVHTNGGQVVADAFMRIYGVDIKKAGALNGIYLDVKRIG